jgi:hypothetical protein
MHHFIRATQERLWDGEAERFGCSDVNDQLERGRAGFARENSVSPHRKARRFIAA